MGKKQTQSPCLLALAAMAVPLLKEAEKQCPRTGRGKKPDYPDWFIGVLIMIAVLKKKKTKSAQYRFWKENYASLRDSLGGYDLIARSGYFSRYRQAHKLFKTAIRLQGEKAIAEGVADPTHVAVDKSLISAKGPLWHKKDRKAQRIPKRLHGVDQQSTWGYSEHDGWVQGYSYEVVVSATENSTVFPLLASADTASVKETQTCGEKIEQLPEATETMSVDSGYDSNELGEQTEYDAKGRRTGRRFLCPENPRNTKPKLRKKSARRKAPDSLSRRRRRQRRRFLESAKGQRLYARRKETVEPFNDWFKSLFELEDRVWHRGLNNNCTQLLTAIFAYQTLVRYNYRRGKKNGQVCWIMDAL